ncbi:hypothetical protein D9M73_273160 [compost metagenome]
MTSDQTNTQSAVEKAVWDQYFCAALVAESHLSAPVVGGPKSNHEDRQNLLVERARLLADKMMEHRK